MSAAMNIDPLVDWIVERAAIAKRQATGEPPPWSKDELFATYRFCNVNVQADRVSRAIFETFTQPYADHPGLIVALTVCRFTNAPEVFEAVKDCLVPFVPQRFVAIMADRAARGLLLERRAYMIPGGGKGELKAASLTRDLFIPLANAVEQIRPKPGDTCAEVFGRLRAFPHLGKGFITAQIVRDLKQAGPLRLAPDWKEFVWPGPGSQRGVNRLLGATTEADIERERPESEWCDLFWEIVNLAAPRIAEQGIEVADAQSWQNGFCETDKMLRWRGMSHKERMRHGARLYVPYGKAPPPRSRKTKPALAPTEPPPPIEQSTSIESLVPAPHAIPELAAARDPNAPHVLFHDIETRSTLDLKTVGAHRYAADPTTEVLCLGYAVDAEPPQLWTPGDPVPMEFVEAAQNPAWTVVAHNDAFERVISQHILGPRHNFPAIPIERRRCSMTMALAAALPGALDKAAAALELPHEKDKAGQANMRRMAKPLAPGIWIEDHVSRERLYAYCRADVEAERALYRALPPLTADEGQIWQLDAVINARGFHVDGDLLDAAARVVAEATTARQAEFERITGLNSVNKTEKLIIWLAERGCAVTDVQKGTMKHALRRKGLAPEVRRAIELRLELAHASAAKVEALRAWRGNDGRVRGTLRFAGAATGRWSGHGPQPQNLKRDAEHVAGKIAAVLAGGVGLESPVEVVGDVARAMICAPPAHRLMIADFSGIESRVLAWVSGQQSKVDAWVRFDRTGDPSDEPYVRIAQRCGLAGEGARDIGKRIDLAFGFGGALGAWNRAAPEDDTTDEATAQRYLQTWRAEHPATVGFWYALSRAAVSAVRYPGTSFPVRRLVYRFDPPFLRVTLPVGRAITYPFAQIDGEDRFRRPKLTFMDTAGGRFEPCNHGNGAWHGMLVENIVQAVARDLLATALLRLEAAGYPVVLHVHDEIVAEVPEGFGSLDEFRRIIVEPPAWAEGLPIAAKAREALRFSKQDAPARAVEITVSASIVIEIKSAQLGITTAKAEVLVADLSVQISADIPFDDIAHVRDLYASTTAPPYSTTTQTSENGSEPNPAPDAEPRASQTAAGAIFEPPPIQTTPLDGREWSTPNLTEVPPGSAEFGAILATLPEDRAIVRAPTGGNGHASRHHDVRQGWYEPAAGPSNRHHGSDGYLHGDGGSKQGAPASQWVYAHPEQPNYLRVDKHGLPNGERRFYQHHWNGMRWVYGVKGTYAERKIPYRLLELKAALQANPDAEVQLAEGEKDADTLARLGFVATTNPGGALSWTDDLTAWLRILGVRRAVIHEDNDEKGRQRTAKLTAALAGFIKLRIVRYSDVPEGEDVTWWLEHGHGMHELRARIDAAKPPTGITILSKAEFVRGFVPPDYVVDGVLQRRFLYSLTGQVGHAKTAIALRLAASVDHGSTLAGHSVARGRVAYLVGENADDVRMRVIGDDSILGNRGSGNIIFVPGVFDTDALLHEVAALGELDLVIVDTSAAYFLGDDENSNAEMGEHARKLRRLITLPGGPCVLVLCHPIKHAADPTQLLPRGGGAFLAEVDGNLTAWKDDRLVTLHHSDKFRGPGFEPITLRLDSVLTEELKDSQQRLIPTVRAVAISEAEEVWETEAARSDEDQVLVARLRGGRSMSIADLACALDWVSPTSGKPYKSKVHRVLVRLKAAGLTMPHRGKWDLTPKGEKAAQELESGGTPDSRKNSI
jgi:DNA polymerase